MSFLLLAVGLVLLVLGAELLVRGASRLAAVVGVSPLVIGLTVVAYGTSMPEMAVSAVAGYSGQADIALGNVVGSNIFNVLLILGISAVITPLVVSQQLVKLDVPLMIVVSFLVLDPAPEAYAPARRGASRTVRTVLRSKCGKACGKRAVQRLPALPAQGSDTFFTISCAKFSKSFEWSI